MTRKLVVPPQAVAIVDGQGRVTPLWYQAFSAAFEEVERQAVAAKASADAAAQAAVNAQESADNAAGEAGSVSSSTSLQLSYPVDLGFGASDLGASSGSDIAMTNHIRRYGDGTQVNVVGDVISPFAYDTTYYVYYDDPSRTGGVVSYQTALIETEALSSAANPARHYIGNVLTPSDGAPPNAGTPGLRS